MNFRQHLKAPASAQINFIPLINLLVLFFAFYMLFAFTQAEGIKLGLPRAITSEIANQDNIIIVVTSENIFYHKSKVVTLKDLKSMLTKTVYRKQPVLIKADRRASIGRVAELWDMGRNAGIERINIATYSEP